MGKSPKSGKPTGAGRPSGTAEQRAYYGAPTTPSGTARTSEPSAEFKAKLEEDIKAQQEAQKQYVISGKSVTAEEYQKATAGKEVIGVRSVTREEQIKQSQIQAQREAKTRAIQSMAGTRTMEEFLKKATPEEKQELLRRSEVKNILVGSRGTQLLRMDYNEPRERGVVVKTRTGETRFIPEKEKIIKEDVFYGEQKLKREEEARVQRIQKEEEQRIQQRWGSYESLSLRGQIERYKQFVQKKEYIPFGIGFVETGYQTIRHPYQTIIKPLFTPIKTAKETGKFLLQTARTGDPYAVGQIAFMFELPSLIKYGTKLTGKAIERFPFVKKAKAIKPTKQLIKAVEPFTRKRATLMLTDEQGRYILGTTKTGEKISVGGGIKKGQTSRGAVLSELKQETGLTLKDLTDLTYKSKVVFPEETHFVYTARLSAKALKKIKPSSDITSIDFIRPGKARGVKGQTSFYPVEKGGVRSYELGLINYLETGQRPTWLIQELGKFKGYSDTFLRREAFYSTARVQKPSILKPSSIMDFFYGRKPGQFRRFGQIETFGTQSRYDVAWKQQKKFLKQQELQLTHGTTAPAVIRKYAPYEKEFEILKGKSKRGETGLYLQPPVSAVKGAPGYAGLSYMGFGRATSEGLGLKIGWERPTAYTMKESPKYPITTTAKAIAGVEEELLIREGAIKTAGRAKTIWMGGKRVFIQPTELIRNAKVSKLYNKLHSDISTSERRRIINQLKRETGMDYSQEFGGYKYISPFETLKLRGVRRKEERISYEEPTTLKQLSFYPSSYSRKQEEKYFGTKYIRPSYGRPSRTTDYIIPYEKEPYREPTLYERPTYGRPSYGYPYRTFTKTTPYPYEKPRRPIVPPPIIPGLLLTPSGIGKHKRKAGEKYFIKTFFSFSSFLKGTYGKPQPKGKLWSSLELRPIPFFLKPQIIGGKNAKRKRRKKRTK